MATDHSTLEFLLDQLAALPGVTARRMFGEYCLYLDGKPVGLVCDDQLYLKPTPAGRARLDLAVEDRPYPGARPHLLVAPDQWEDAAWLCDLVAATAAELPAPKPKPASPAKATRGKPHR